MKRTSSSVLILLLMWSVFGAAADEVKAVTVTEGDSVTLNPLQGLKGIDLLLWRFGDKGSTIAQINDNTISYPNYTEIFKGRLKLNQTGSLTINNTRAKHSGLYNLKIDHSGGNSEMNFIVTVNEPPPLIDAPEAEIMSLSVVEGNPVILHTGVPQLHEDELIVWRFGDKEKLMAIDDKETKSKKMYDTDERFRHRLELNDQTGSLIIKNMKDTDAGLYAVKVSSNKQITYKKFIVTVSGSGVSPSAVAGIVVLLMVVATVAVLSFLYHRHKTSKLQKQLDYFVTAKGNIFQTAAGGDVNMKMENEPYPGDVVQWRFKNESSLIAEIKDGKISTYDGPDGIFRGRLKLDETGSLTIRDIRPEHTGDYTIEINKRSRGETTKKIFMVYLEEKRIPVEEGESVTLMTDTEIQRDDEIQWLFGDQDQVIARMTGETSKIEYPDERFRDRLELDKKTGSLSINNISLKHTGVFKLKIVSSSSGRTRMKKFSLFFLNPDGTEKKSSETEDLLNKDGQSAV